MLIYIKQLTGFRAGAQMAVALLSEVMELPELGWSGHRDRYPHPPDAEGRGGDSSFMVFLQVLPEYSK